MEIKAMISELMQTISEYDIVLSEQQKEEIKDMDFLN